MNIIYNKFREKVSDKYEGFFRNLKKYIYFLILTLWSASIMPFRIRGLFTKSEYTLTFDFVFLVSKSLTTLKKFKIHEAKVCVCVCVCVSLASDSSDTIKVIIVKHDMMTAFNMGMHYVLIIFTLTFIQGHTDLNHESNTCLVISGANEAMPINFAVKIVQLKVYLTIASLIILTFNDLDL